jgi:hypothetical protein
MEARAKAGRRWFFTGRKIPGDYARFLKAVIKNP